MINLKISDTIFDHFLRTETPPHFKVLMRLCRLSKDHPNSEVELHQSDLCYNCNLSQPTVNAALRHLEQIKAIQRLPNRSFHTERRYKVLEGDKINLPDLQNPRASQPVGETLESLKITTDMLAVIMADLKDTKFMDWHNAVDIKPIRAEFDKPVSYQDMRNYFSERVFPHTKVTDEEIITTYHMLKGEGQL